jgi:hypothetical protein
VIFIYLFIFENLANRGNFPIQNPVYNSTLNQFFSGQTPPHPDSTPSPTLPSTQRKKKLNINNCMGTKQNKTKIIVHQTSMTISMMSCQKQTKQTE